MTTYTRPNTQGSLLDFAVEYQNFIGGEFVAPVKGNYGEVRTPVTGQVYTSVARSTSEDVDRAVDVAWKAFPAWSRASNAERAEVLWRIAERIDEHREEIALAETWDNGKPIRETLGADIPLAADHFRYFAATIRAQEQVSTQIDHDTVSYQFREPLGVVAQIIPWNFPILMAAWKIAPALAAGNTIVMKPASETPISLLILVERIQDLLPPGVLNIVEGKGSEIGTVLSRHPRIRKLAFTGSTEVGRDIALDAAQLLIPATLELGGKSPNIFFDDIADHDDGFYQKALEGFNLFAFNKGEVCTCPSRALVQKSIFDSFVPRAVARLGTAKQINPLDTDCQVGPQVSARQRDKILDYIRIGKQEGATVRAGGGPGELDGDLAGGYYIQPTVLEGENSMRIFQEEIFGPVLALTPFEDYDDAIRIANDTSYGLGAGVWTRNGNRAYRAGRAILAGRVWTNCYHMYPAGAPFGGYKESGIGRETDQVILNAYQQIKDLLVSYTEAPQGLF
ncbi:Aldehyde dehydrogenase (NAD(+)) [Acidipropionibacterium acidipropionici ATCC 4875]|uniref:Aldehyde dehydrogenase (NAD(+)) n=1 Tax=Acidipropionibacterium acidipropionici (strain ATCC 4875 / DSM 20272 / JCM 6432 / NBRC 12425 / NCIMB 8070 / 4) TaxID=1171373 RepID=K7S0M9_ACIA4|nr:aldehyde dehydrogenase family protein [Acidipropionibacterium acidipropionici]AFV88147.1 Aldehyde dehydrogenase (NAD(+)) [Acidipropionibacterium acidipropionici ATCC 4875]